MSKIINEGLKECIEINNGKCIYETEGSLICVHGNVMVDETLIDDIFGTQLENGIKLVRIVQIFQYVEEKYSDDDTEYKKIWVHDIVDSSNFVCEKIRGKNEIKSNKFFRNKTFYANEIRIGDYILNHELKDLMTCEEKLSIKSQESIIKFDEINNKTNKKSQIQDDMIFCSKYEGSKPKLGDLRVRYDYLKAPKSFTIIARQKNNRLEPYYGKNTEKPQENLELNYKESHSLDINSNLLEKSKEKLEKSEKTFFVKIIRNFMDDSIKINWIFEGSIPLEICFAKKMKKERKIIWLLRLVGFLMKSFGVYFFLTPLLAFLKWIPIIGTSVSIIFFFFSLSAGFSLSLITISIAWIFYRSLVGGFMIFTSVMLYILTVYLI